jgi:transposase
MTRKRSGRQTGQAPGYVLGIDIAKETFDVALADATGTVLASAQFSNDEAGGKELRKWLQQRKAKQVHACLEATGRYGELLAHYLYAQGYQVSVVNPARIHAYGQSKLQRNKTDRQDARLIADFCASQRPELWSPPPPEQQELHDLARRLATLKKMRQQEENRLKSGVLASGARRSIEQHIAFLRQQIVELEAALDDHRDHHPGLQEQVDLLDSIPGIGPTTAYAILGELTDITYFGAASQLAAHAGLTPAQRCSGSSVRGKTTLSKKGNARLRAALYMPAITARRCSPAFRTFADRLADKAKSKMAVIGAVMHKLIRVIYGVLKSGQPFNPKLYLHAATP